MHRKRNRAIGVLLFFAALGLACYFIPKADDLHVQQVQETQKKLFELPPGTAPEKRRELFGQMREQVDQLTPEQRQEFARKAPPAFLKHINQRVSAYFGLPPEERVAFLDKEIKRMEEMLRDMRAARGASGEGGPPGPPPGRDMSGEGRDQMQRKFLDSTTPLQRAQLSDFFKALQKRRQELGLATLPPPPF